MVGKSANRGCRTIFQIATTFYQIQQQKIFKLSLDMINRTTLNYIISTITFISVFLKK